MKKVIRSSIIGRSNSLEAEHGFTVKDVVQLLERITELRGLDISTSKSEEGDTVFLIGDASYEMNAGF